MPFHRMLIAKDQPCCACIKHGFSNQTGFVQHSPRSDWAPCKRTVKHKRTRHAVVDSGIRMNLEHANIDHISFLPLFSLMFSCV